MFIIEHPQLGAIRTMLENGSYLWNATDIAKALGYKIPRKAIKDHCREIQKRIVPHPQNPEKNIETNFIPESDLLRLISHSRLDCASQLEKWIYDTAVTALHNRNGVYPESKNGSHLLDIFPENNLEKTDRTSKTDPTSRKTDPTSKEYVSHNVSIIDFLHNIFHVSTDLFTYIWSRTNDNNRKRANSFKISQLDSLVNVAKNLNAEELHVSFSMGLLDHAIGTYQRAKDIDIVAIPCLWCDIDIASEVHGQSQKLAPDLQTAISFLPNDLYPSIIVNSGFGIHAYWILDDLLSTRTNEERARAKKLLTQLQSIIRHNANGCFIDNTADLSRMLRLPDTTNWKSGNKKDAPICHVIEASGELFSVEDVENTLNTLTAKMIPVSTNPRQISNSQREFVETKSSNSNQQNQSVYGDSSTILEHCDAIKFLVDNIETVANYDSMKTILPIFLACNDGTQFAIDLCKRWLGSKFDPNKTQAQLDGLKKLKPATCQSIRRSGAKCNFDSCPVCQAGKHSPIAILNSPIVRRKILGDIGGTIGEMLPDAPDNIAILIPPEGFRISDSGIDFETEKAVIKASFTPFVISKFITREIHDGEDESIIFWEISRRIAEGNWQTHLIPTKTINKLPDLAVALLESNVNADSNQTRAINKFLVAFKAFNEFNIPRIQLVDKLGWRSDFRFIHPAFQADESGNEIYRLAGLNITDSIIPHGNREDALNLWRSAKQYPFARLLFIAQFAAPLLRWTGCRNFTVYLWGQSQSGKTAALVGANSVWGNSDFMADFNSTMKSLIDLAIERNDLPTNINEWQLVDDRNKRDIASKLLRGHESGKSRGKLRRDGTQIPKKEFNGITVATGEVPMTGADAKHGEKTRILEIRVDGVIGHFQNDTFILDDDTCEKFYSNHRDKTTYGILGVEWIRFIQDKLKDGSNFFKYAFQLTYSQLKKLYPDHQESHLQYIALFTITDVLVAEKFDNIDEETAMDDTNTWIKFLLPLIETKNQIRDADRARDLIADWYNVNEAYFGDSVERGDLHGDQEMIHKKIFKRLGYITHDGDVQRIWAIPAELRDYLKKQGFDPDAIIRSLAESGDLDVDLEKNLSIVKRIEGKPRRVIGLKFLSQSDVISVLDNEPEDVPPEQIPW